MIQEGYHPLIGTHGFLFKKLPQDIHAEVKSVVDNVQKDFTKAIPLNDKLVGQIDKEYLANLTNKATQYIKYTVEEYTKFNPQYIKQQTHSNCPRLSYDGECWINFQEKYEYNPMHSHSGVFSYVIWYQIPYYKADETKYGAGKGRAPQGSQNGDFSFIFYDGEEVVDTTLRIDKSMEGYMAIFPSRLNHVVYPFYTSDDYRITVSGNVLPRG